MERLGRSLAALIPPQSLTVGLSGGPDSTLALLVALAAARQDPRFLVRAVHCIHGLDRSDDHWLRHCQSLCARLGVPLTTPRLRIVPGRGESPEERSRLERYQALHDASGGGALVLGHHRGDQAEGLLLALSRGSGPRGLGGMGSITTDARGILLRPLLGLGKREIEDLLEALGFTYLFDESNAGGGFARNFWRQQALPLLRQRYPGIERCLARSASLCAMEHDLAWRVVGPCLGRAQEGGALLISRLPRGDRTLALAVLRAFLEQGSGVIPSLALCEQALSCCEGPPDQAVRLSLGGLLVRRFRDRLCLVRPLQPPPRGGFPLRQGESLCLGDYRYALEVGEEGDPAAFCCPQGEVWLDFAYLGSEIIRPRLRAHRRSVKKLYVELGIAPWERPALPLVRDGEGGEVLALGDRAGVRGAGGEWRRLVIGESTYF